MPWGRALALIARRRAILVGLTIAAITNVECAAGRRGRFPADLGEIELAGGVPAARQVFSLGDAAGRLDAGLVDDFVRRFSKRSSWNDWSERFARYVEFLAAVRAAAREWPGGVRLLSPSAPKADRERVKDYLALLGLELREARGHYTALASDSGPAKEHSAWLGAAGVDLPAVATKLNSGETVPIVVERAMQPLPLPQFWEAHVFERGHPPIADLVHDRASALLYAALLTLDDETLRFLAGRPRLVMTLRDEAAGAFSAFARRLRIHAGAVDLPGGPDAEPIWRDLTGRKPADTEAFVEALFTKDDGRAGGVL